MIEELGKGIDSLSLSSFNQLFHPYSTILSASECIVPSSHSTVTSTLVGGNLAVLTSIIGSPYEIITNNTLLLLEDIGEEPYRIDRMLNQLLLSGKFNECRALFSQVVTTALLQSHLNHCKQYYMNISRHIIYLSYSIYQLDI